MPGLVGIFSKNKVDEYFINKMINSIKHYDYFKTDKFVESNFGSARVHLGIFNPEPQPIFNEDKSLCIFMDGKIYDYETERKKLTEKGYNFQYGNDPEFILHCYEEYRSDFVPNLNGSFVFVIVDLKKNKIVLVNDRYGLRPIYYKLNESSLIFASEIKAILETKNFKKELNYSAMADFFSFGFILGNKTFFKNIQLLPAASIAVYDKELSIKQYWNFNFNPDYSKTENEFVDDLVKSFNKAVDVRINEKYRYGVSLSGGLDSRIIVGAINENKRKKFLSFSFGPVDCDEIKIARKVAKKAGTKFKLVNLNPDDLSNRKLVEKVIYLTDGQDIISVSFLPYVFSIIRDDINIYFQGLAGDLLLGGSYLNGNILKAENEDKLLKILLKKNIFTEEEFKKLFSKNFYKKIDKIDKKNLKGILKKIETDNMPNKWDIFFLEKYVCRFTIMGSVIDRNYCEEAVPTYDNNFIDLVLTIPPNFRYKHRIYRRFLKKLSPELAKIPYNKTMVRADAPIFLWEVGKIYQFGKEYLKKKITLITNKKIEFKNRRVYVNFEEWLRFNDNWKKIIEDLLLSSETKSRKIYNQEYIMRIIKEHQSGKYNHSQKLLYMISFESFLRLFFKEIEI